MRKREGEGGTKRDREGGVGGIWAGRWLSICVDAVFTIGVFVHLCLPRERGEGGKEGRKQGGRKEGMGKRRPGEKGDGHGA